MNTLESKLLEVILKDLPNQTSGPLRDYMNQAEEQKKQLEVAQKKILELEAIIRGHQVKEKELLSEIDKYIKLEEEFKNGIIKNTQKELELQKKEVEIEVSFLQIKLACEERITTKQEKFLSLLVKNPVSMEYFRESKYNPGGYKNNPDGSTTHIYGGDIKEERDQKIETTKQE